tara:strand:+ start:10745 stop:11536 length:792 start_codon:yes stop_codon:yes gene_type:complete
MSLTGKTLADTYKDLLQVDNSNNGVDATTRRIRDGEGNQTAVSISDDIFGVQPVNDNTAATFLVTNNSGTTLFDVNTTDSRVNALGNDVNTQYATFAIRSGGASAYLANTHHPLAFAGDNYNNALTGIPAFGTGTDPATSFTTADSNKQMATDIVPCLWYVMDDISIDSVISIEGADNATGDTTRMHLFSYDFTSGSTSALSNGTLLAHNNDVTNAGNEQAYTGSWTVDSAAVSSGKVILAFFRSDSINSDYSVQLTVKYHLT